jgi:exodeoxyribonuclease VII small subunit
MPADDAATDPSPDEIGYADAVAELEEILVQLDGDDVDVDHLATQVRRAAELIALCRSRLSAARMEVTRIVADLDGVGPAPSAIDDDGLDDAWDDADEDEDEERASVASDGTATALDDGLFADGAP